MKKKFKHDEPVKFDSKKIRMELLPPDALFMTAQVFTHGAAKYEDRNWERGISWERYIGAMFRHMLLFMMGEDTDPDSGFPVLAHISCNALFLLSSYLREIGEDNRWKFDDKFINKMRKIVDDYTVEWEGGKSEENKPLHDPYDPNDPEEYTIT